jgi:DNA-binding GntR family transcriptional regulator
MAGEPHAAARGALKVLAAEGLVGLVQNRGCRVIELSEADAEALFPVMALLEGRCAHEAARKTDDAGLTPSRSATRRVPNVRCTTT